MYRIAICDDETQMLNRIYTKVKACLEEKDISAEYLCFHDARKLMERLGKGGIDLLFLDIDMPYFNGMDIAGYILEKNMKTILVFVTSYDALVYQSFAYKPFGFIRKTHLEDELPELAKRVQKELDGRKQELTVAKGQEITRIKLKEIAYIEAEGNYLNIFTLRDIIRVRETMTHIENELKNKDFIRCHKGYLVNAEFITKIKAAELEVQYNGASRTVPIGRSYEKAVRREVLLAIRN